MKIDQNILKFPKSLPNDDQHFMTYFPYKFPKVMEFYEEVANKYWDKPAEYAQFVRDQFNELESAVYSINEEYQTGDKDDLNFLVDIDQKFNKVFCFKFWVINYVFADGPLHEFYVDKLKAFARKCVEVTDDFEEYEDRILRIQRDLMQTDYADIYLVQALHGVKVMEFFENDKFSKEIVEKITLLLDKHHEDNNQEVNKLWEPIVERMMDENDDHYSELRDKPEDFVFNTLLDLPPLSMPITQVRMRKTNFPLYSYLSHCVEFRNENISLEKRYQNMKQTIKEIFEQAKNNFSKEEYEDFVLSYEMSKNFSMSKDIMGEVDPILIPCWVRELHKKVYEILSKTHEVRYPNVSHAAMFISFVWYLPDDLKAKVISVDNTFFEKGDY